MMWLALGIVWVDLALFKLIAVKRREKLRMRWLVVMAVLWTVIILLYGQLSGAMALRQAAVLTAGLAMCFIICSAAGIMRERRRRRDGC